MKKFAFFIILWFTITTSFAQNEIHKKVTDSFILNFNNNDFELIFNSFSTKMQNSRPKNYFLNLFNRVKKEYGNLLFLELTDYQENSQMKSRGKYDGHFEAGKLQIKITVNQKGEIIGLYILKDKIAL